MQLTASQYTNFLEALQDAFPTKQKLKQFVREFLGKNLELIALGEDLKEIISKVVDNAEEKGWIDELIMAAGEANPKNLKLSTFIESYAREYWNNLDDKAELIDINEEKARLAIIKVQSELTPIFDAREERVYSDELVSLLTQILSELSKSNAPAAYKAKLVLPLIPGILAYEHELDMGKSLKVVFQPIRKLLLGK
jgi:hypothetical protein